MEIDKKIIYLLFVYLGLAFCTLFLSAVWWLIPSFMISILCVFLVLSLFSKKIPFLITPLLFIYALIIGGELASVYNSGAMIEVLTLTNITEVSSVDKEVIYSSIIILMLFIAPIFLFRMKDKVFVKKSVCIFICGGIALSLCFLPKKTEPISYLEMTVRAYAHQVFFKPDNEMMNKQKEIYAKNTVYEDTGNVPDLHMYNVVTIFAEGFSLEFIDKFNSYSNLTPNISRLLEDSLWFDNYYNHTAATFCGIRGQLCSSFQYQGGWYGNTKGASVEGFYFENQEDLDRMHENTVISVPQILQKNGYHTYFLSAHAKKDKINAYFETFGFEKVFTANDFKNGDEPLTDKELFAALSELIKGHKLQEPYFIGVYNLETHIGFKSSDLIYNYQGKTNNDLLNVWHNFDGAFGKFMQEIKNQPKLAIVITADHAAYPSQLYHDTFGDERQNYAGKIPLILYYDGVKEERMDALGRNSLDFAPTLLNWLRVNKAKNYFLGCSLYDEKCAFDFHYVFNQSDEFYYTNRLQHLDENNVKDTELIQKIKDFYHLSDEKVF